MPTFVYSGRQAGRLVEGMVDAPSVDRLLAQLTERGVTPISVTEDDGAAPESTETGWLSPRRKVGLDELILLSRQLRSLTQAGVPIARAIRGLSESVPNKVLADVLEDVVASLEAGTDLATSLRRHDHVFSNLYVSVVHVGENTGRLDQAFAQISKYLELEKETRQRFKSATRYPLIVMAAIGVALTIISLFVIPAFADAFNKFDAELPWQTQVLLAVSGFTVDYWYLMLAAGVGAWFGFRAWIDTERGRLKWDELKLRLPLIGGIFDRINLSRFCQTFSMVLSAGVPVNQGLAIVGHATGNAFFASKIQAMQSGIEGGERVSNVARNSELFSPVVLQMIAIGEETGRMDVLLAEAATFYEEEVDYRLKGLSEAIEPIMVIAIGGMVLVLALGVFLPLWDLSSVALK